MSRRVRCDACQSAGDAQSTREHSGQLGETATAAAKHAPQYKCSHTVSTASLHTHRHTAHSTAAISRSSKRCGSNQHAEAADRDSDGV